MMQILDGGPKSLAPVDICPFARPVRRFERIVGGRGSFLRPLHTLRQSHPIRGSNGQEIHQSGSSVRLFAILSISDQRKRPTASFLH